MRTRVNWICHNRFNFLFQFRFFAVFSCFVVGRYSFFFADIAIVDSWCLLRLNHTNKNRETHFPSSFIRFVYLSDIQKMSWKKCVFGQTKIRWSAKKLSIFFRHIINKLTNEIFVVAVAGIRSVWILSVVMVFFRNDVYFKFLEKVFSARQNKMIVLKKMKRTYKQNNSSRSKQNAAHSTKNQNVLQKNE